MESPTQKAEPRVHPQRPPSSRQGETVQLEDLIHFLRRSTLFILGVALVAAVSSTAYLFTRRPVYQASAVLALRTDREQLAAQTLLMPVQGYLRLIRSRPTLTEAQHLLRIRGYEDISAGMSMTSLAVRLIQGERWEQNNVTLLEIESLGQTPEAAIRAANAWAEACVLVDEAQTRDAALEAVQADLIDLLAQGEETRLKLAAKLAVARRQLAGIPPLLTVEATLSTPEELVHAAEGESPARLISQQLNPLHQQLASQIAQLEADLATAEQQIERSSSDLDFVRHAFQDREQRAGTAVGSEGTTGTGTAEMERQAEPEGLGIKVTRALSAPGALSVLQPAVEAQRLERGGGKALKALAAALGGAIFGFLVAAGREALRTSSGS